MRKEITIVKYIYVYDFCGIEDDSNNWIYSCEICGKHMCEECDVWVHADEAYIDILHVCQDCVKKDFTKYKQLAKIKRELYRQIDELSDEQDKILEETREGSGVVD